MSMCKVGLFWSLTVSAFIGLGTAYGLALMDWVSTALETDTRHHHRLKNAEEICERIDRPFMGITKVIMIIGSMALMLGSSISNIIMVVKNMHIYLGIDPTWGKLIVFTLGCILLLIVIEPESISKFLTISVAIMIFISKLPDD
jgi:hypothetical protein